MNIVTLMICNVLIPTVALKNKPFCLLNKVKQKQYNNIATIQVRERTMGQYYFLTFY